MATKNFLITGVSSGLGRAFAVAALDAGHNVIGSVRTPEAATAYQAIAPGRAHPVMMDVADADAAARCVVDAQRRFGAVEVLVNNAGYGHEGVVEESSVEELRRQFDANFFGAVAITKVVLPGMRRRRSGRIINVTSAGGFVGGGGIAFYCASKFALEGFSESLGKEVKPFGVHVTTLAPGQFRTDWAGRSMDRAPRGIPAYDAIMDPIRAARQTWSGKQPGDPAKAAMALLTLVEAEAPPARLFLGDDALAAVDHKLKQVRCDLEAWEAVSRATRYD